MEQIEAVRQPKWRKRLTALTWAALVVALVLGFGQNFAEMWIRWFPAWGRPGLSLYGRVMEGQSYYTHGPLVPVISLIIMLLLMRFTRIPVKPCPGLGGAVLGVSLLVHLGAALARVNFASGFAFIGVLVGLVLILWGKEALRRLWFPLALLLFMVPLPEVSIAQLNFRLKMLAADWGVRLASLLGVVAIRTGNEVWLPGDKVLVIANVCNGLRTLISVIAFGAIYAYVCRLRGWWRLGLFGMSVPVAVVANTIRIASLIVVADIWDVKLATGWYHDTSGLFIFVLAFLMMFGIERLVLWIRVVAKRPLEERPLFAGLRRGPEDEGQWGRMWRAAGGRRGWTALAALAAAAGLTMWLGQVKPSAWTQQMASKSLPRNLEVEGLVWNSRDRELDQLTQTILETSDYLYRQYVRAGEQPVDFVVIFSKDNRKGTHPPDLCLEGGGEQIVEKGSVAVGGIADRGSVPCRELITQGGARKWYYLYTYKCGRSYTGSFWMQQWTILTNGLLDRNSSGALIRISTPVTGSIEEARRRATAFLRVAIPHLDQALP